MSHPTSAACEQDLKEYVPLDSPPLEESLPSMSESLAHSEIGSALLRHFSKYGDIFVRPKEL
jgi:hypothetical protein